jgi:hypothetical protein
MTVSSGGSISWTPATDSVYLAQVDYLVIDDYNNRDTSSVFIYVNQPTQTAAKHFSSHVIPLSEIVVTLAPASHGFIMNFSRFPGPSDLYLYNLSGRLIDKLIGVSGTTVLWQPKSMTAGSYILQAKNGADRRVKRFVMR